MITINSFVIIIVIITINRNNYRGHELTFEKIIINYD